MSRAKDTGTYAETHLVRHLQDELGLSDNEVMRRVMQGGGNDRGDVRISLIPMMIEVKNRKTLAFGSWEREVARQVENARAEYGVLVWSPPGLGPKRIGEWLAFEWPDSTLTPFTGRGFVYPGPLTKLAGTARQYGGPIYLPNPGVTRFTGPIESWARCRVRYVADWVEDLREYVAAKSLAR